MLTTFVSIKHTIRVARSYARLTRSQYWDKDALEIHAQRRIEETLRAAAQIPFYRERLAGKSFELSSYPILKRSDIPVLNASARELIVPKRKFFHDNSSGSTGMPVEFLFDNAHQTGRYAARIRYLRANGWHPMKRCAWIVATTSDDDDNPDSALMKSRLRLRSNFLPMIFRPFDEQVDALLAARPEFLYTMPSNLDGLLQAFERRALRLDCLKLIFTGAEVLEDSLRERARRILGVEIRDNYGSTEGFIAWQCPAASYHINAEHMFVEIVDERGFPVSSGQMGRVLLTTLENHLMPLIRYEIGDYAIGSDEVCSCGRSLPLMGRIIGRGINLFRLPDGRLKSPWPLVGPLKRRAELHQFQIVQETHHHYLVRYVSDRELDHPAQEAIRVSFGRILDLEVTIAFQRMDSIPRTSGAKFMTALSLLQR